MAENTARNLLILGGLGVLGYYWYTSMGSAQAAEGRSTPSGGGATPSGGGATPSGGKSATPSVELSAPANGAAYKPGESVSFLARARGPFSSVKIEWNYNGKVVSIIPMVAPSDGSDVWSLLQQTSINAVPGVYTLRAIATDTSGRQTASNSIQITFAAAAPEATFAEEASDIGGGEDGLRGGGWNTTTGSTTESGKSSWGTPTGEVSTAQGRENVSVGVSFEDTSNYFALGPSDYSYRGGDYGTRG